MPNNTVDVRPNTITISAAAEEYMEATHADVALVIRGTSLFSGNAALRKAREVAALVAELAGIGITEDSVELRGVHAEVATGSLGTKSSTAIYSLRIRDVPLEQIADVVGVVTSQKNVVLHGIDWRYGDEEATQLRLLAAALRQAKAKAETTARTLETTLHGVYSMTEKFTDEEGNTLREPMLDTSASYGRARERRVSSEELGLAVTHHKHVTQSVQVIFRVGD